MMLRLINLLVFLMFCGLLNVNAQNISLTLRNATVKEAIEAVKSKTGKSFFFKVGDVNMNGRVSLSVDNAPVEEVLSLIFKGQPVGYEVKENNIVLFRQTAPEAKGRVVTGRVTDDNGEPLVGVNILLDGECLAITDLDGNYTLQAPEGKELTYSYVGYGNQKRKVRGGGSVDVVLTDDSKLLDEVVVVGYGTQKKVNLTGAVGYIDSKAIENRPVSNLGQAIQGAIPNLNISFGSGKPGESTMMNVRGFASINQESKPLVLIDGVEGSIDEINPRDVESISVLKDASSAAIYGARAPFGVVLVTTKRGKSGEARVNYNGRFSFSKQTTSTDFMTSGYDAAMLVDEFQRSFNGSTYTRYSAEDYAELEKRRYDKVENPERPWTVVKNIGGRDTYMYYANFDWYNYLIDTSRPTWNHNVSISGGNDKINYMVSGNFNDQKGIYAQNPDRYMSANFRARVFAKVKPWLDVNVTSAMFFSRYKAPGLANGDNMANYTFHAMPFLMPYNPDGTHVFQTSIIAQQPTDGVHIMTADGYSHSLTKKREYVNTVGLTFNIIDGLKFNVDYSLKYGINDNVHRSADAKFSQYPGVEQPVTGDLFKNKLRQLYEQTMYHNVNAYANYDRTFANHHVYGVAGFNYEQNEYKRVYVTQLNVQSDNLNDFNLGDKTKDVTVEGGHTEWALLGYFGRLGYDYAGKYLGEVNLRWDASSRFPLNQRSGLFPSVSLGYRISEEAFFSPLRSVVSNLKIRGSIGKLGNQAISDCYPYIQSIGMNINNGYLLDGSYVTYANVSAPPASNLTWETIVSKNLGIDLSLFNNRLTFSTDLFIRDTKDMLVPGKRLPGVYGASSPKENAADLTTRGFELTIGWNDQFDLLGKPFSYNVAFSLADSHSRITKFDNPMKEFSKSNYYVGMEIGEIWGYHVSGLFQTDEEAKAYQDRIDHSFIAKNILETASGKYKGLQAGDMIFEDLDGSGRIDDGKRTADDRGDMRIIGNSSPHYAYSANIGFNWYGVDFSAFFQGIGKQQVYPGGNAMLFWGGFARPYSSFTPANFMDQIWSEENPDGYFPRIRGYAAQGDRTLAHVNDRYLQNLAYCRLKNLTIGYTLPSELTRKISIDRVRVYFSGDNLATWTKLRSDYIDPEQFAKDKNARVYPYPKTFSFGLDVTF